MSLGVVGIKWGPQSRLMLGMVLALCSPLAAAQIYKWVDENGKTHYSQTPPTQETKKPVQEVSPDTNSGSSVSPRRDENGDLRCGSILLEQAEKTPAEQLAFITMWRKDWGIQLDQARAHYLKVLRRSSRADSAQTRGRRESAIKRRDSLACAVSWSDRRMRALGGEPQALDGEVARLERKLKDTWRRRHERCRHYRDDAPGEYSACKARVEREVEDLRAEISKKRSLSRRLNER